MRLIANRQLFGEYGLVAPGDDFEVRDEIATQLLRAGVVRKADPPTVQYETKVIVPEAPEVSPRQPFRDMPVFDARSPELDRKGNREFSTTDVPAIRTDDPRGRDRRSGSGSKRR